MSSDSIDPAKLNATLNGISQALSERGPKLGQLITEGNAVLSEINPLMPTITDDLRRFTAVADTYGDAADNIVTMLSNATVTSRTIVDEQRNLDALLASAIGLGNSGSDLLRATGTKIVDVARLLVPTTGLLFKYSPSFKCVADQASYNLDYGMGRFGGNTTDYSLDLDVALLFGDDSYVSPQAPAEGEREGRAEGCAWLLLADHRDQLPDAVPGHRYRLQRGGVDEPTPGDELLHRIHHGDDREQGGEMSTATAVKFAAFAAVMLMILPRSSSSSADALRRPTSTPRGSPPRQVCILVRLCASPVSTSAA